MIKSKNNKEEFQKLIDKKINEEEDLDIPDLVNLLHFSSAMYLTNSIYQPTLSGYNDTESSYENKLHELINEKLINLN